MMRKAALVHVLLWATVSGYALAEDAAPTPARKATETTYLRIPIKGVIGTDFTAGSMQHYLRLAAKLRPTVIILEIDTPGGSVTNAESIINQIIESKDYRYVAFVRRALSAGAAISLACPEIYVTETATVGAAVSYFANQQGAPVSLPKDVAEKFQSAWRAVCRKAAQHGKHPGILAEAMIDAEFALTMRKEKGRIVLERNGAGKEIKAKGRILTLTANEAVACGLARGIVPSLESLSGKLKLANWREVAPKTSVAGGRVEDAPGALYKILSDKAMELRLHDGSQTKFQKEGAQEQWNKWLKKAGFIGWRVSWVLTLRQTKKRTPGITLQEYDHRRSMVIKKRQKYIIAYDRHLKAYPFHIEACDYSGCIVVGAWVSKSSEAFLGSLQKYGELTLTGKITGLKIEPRPQGGILVKVEMDQCKAAGRTKRPTVKPKTKPAETPETKAARQLRMARTYSGAGLNDKAKTILKSILEKYPKTEGAKKAREELKKLNPKLP